MVKYNNKSIYNSFQARNVYVIKKISSIIVRKYKADQLF